MPIKIKIGALQGALAKKQISQNGFALYLGTSKGYMSHLMNDRRNPSIKTVRNILDYFENKYAFDDLFFWVPRKKRAYLRKLQNK